MRRVLSVLGRRLMLWISRHPSLEILQEYSDGELSAVDRRRILRHVGTCGFCKERLESRRAVSDMLLADAREPDAAEIAALREQLFQAVDAVSRQVVERDVRHLLGRSAIAEIGLPGTTVTPALRRRLAAFLGNHAASELLAAWSQVEQAEFGRLRRHPV